MKESIGFHDTVNNNIPIIINFNPEKVTLLLDIDNTFPDMEAKRVQAEELELNKKAEFHLTIIGSDTGEKIGESIASLENNEKEKILSKIYTLAESIQRKITLQNKFFYIEKEYTEEDPNDPETLIHEKRKSIIQMAKMDGLGDFYKQLNDVLGQKFEAPLPHITLYTTSTREDKRLRGIGVYSQEQFEQLHPQTI
jgi:hypothetical protein